MSNNILAASQKLMALASRRYGQVFSSSELMSVLKTFFGKSANEVLDQFENHGIIAFVSSRRVKFVDTPTVENIKNLI